MKRVDWLRMNIQVCEQGIKETKFALKTVKNQNDKCPYMIRIEEFQKLKNSYQKELDELTTIK